MVSARQTLDDFKVFGNVPKDVFKIKINTTIRGPATHNI